MQSAAAKPAAPVPPRRSPFLIPSMVIGMLLVLFTGQAVYYRSQIDLLYGQAMRNIYDMPGQARQSFAPINRMSNVLTLGYVREAQTNFLQDLRDSALRHFNYVALPANTDFVMAQQAAAAINDQLRPSLKPEAEAALHLIARAALAALLRVRERGTFTAFQSGMDLFDYLARTNSLTPDIIPNYNIWVGRMVDIDPGPMRMRDTEEWVTTHFNLALKKLNLADSADGPLLVPFPAGLSDKQCMDARKNYREALDTIRVFQMDFPGDLPLEVYRWGERINFNYTMLLLGHGEERGATLPRMGSEFMASCVIYTASRVVPPPQLMYRDYLAITSDSLARAWDEVADPEIERDPRQRAQLMLALWRGRNWLLQAYGHSPDPALPPEVAEGLKPEELQTLRSQTQPVELAVRIN